VGCEERCGRVEHDAAALLEAREHPQAGLDPVERREDVDPPEHEVDRRGVDRLERRSDRGCEPLVGESPLERQVRCEPR
jgi:hypothetical protein